MDAFVALSLIATLPQRCFPEARSIHNRRRLAEDDLKTPVNIMDIFSGYCSTFAPVCLHSFLLKLNTSVWVGQGWAAETRFPPATTSSLKQKLPIDHMKAD